MWHVGFGPLAEGSEGLVEAVAEWREGVVDRRWDGRLDPARHELIVLEPAQSGTPD